MASQKQIACGSFTDPTRPDRHLPYPLKISISCNGAALPALTCDDDSFELEYNPNAASESNRFRVISSVFDNGCIAILDQNNQAITGTI
jgi:hypothetical protein